MSTPPPGPAPSPPQSPAAARPAPRVVVVGSVNVDLVVTLPHLPGAGETVTGGTFSRGPGGKGGNQAVAAARQGARVHFVGAVGDDDHGASARADLVHAGVDTGELRTLPAATGVACVLVDADGENLIAVAPGANAALTAEHVTASLEALPEGPAVVLASLEVPVEAVEAAARVAHDRGWPLVLNPAPARALPPTITGATTVLTPNDVELGVVAPDGPRALLESGTAALVVTRGAAGAEIHRPGREPVHVPAPRVTAVDTTGAGDAFNGALAWALAAGRSLDEAVGIGVRVAAECVTVQGARGVPTTG